jgi:hypothetical protein
MLDAPEYPSTLLPIGFDSDNMLLRKLLVLFGRSLIPSYYPAGGLLPASTVSVSLTADSTANTTVAAGAQSVSITLSSTFTGSINGVAVSGATLSVFNLPQNLGTLYPAVAIVRTTGTYSLLVIR